MASAALTPVAAYAQTPPPLQEWLRDHPATLDLMQRLAENA